MSTSSRPSFSTQQQAWYEQACARIDPKRLQKLLFEIVDIHSPTGAARAASEFMAGHLARVGMDARYHPMTDTSGNVITLSTSDRNATRADISFDQAVTGNVASAGAQGSTGGSYEGGHWLATYAVRALESRNRAERP